jgi:hypothetical protein
MSRKKMKKSKKSDFTILSKEKTDLYFYDANLTRKILSKKKYNAESRRLKNRSYICLKITLI